MERLMAAACFLLTTALEMGGDSVVTCGFEPAIPEGALELGSTATVGVGVLVLRITTGTQPNITTQFVGYFESA